MYVMQPKRKVCFSLKILDMKSKKISNDLNAWNHTICIGKWQLKEFFRFNLDCLFSNKGLFLGKSAIKDYQFSL